MSPERRSWSHLKADGIIFPESIQEPAGNSSWKMLFARVSPHALPITQKRAKTGQIEDLSPKWQVNGAETLQCQFYFIYPIFLVLTTCASTEFAFWTLFCVRP